MKAMFDAATGVPLMRVVREHRLWLLPLGIVLAGNLALLVGVVLPLSRAVAVNEARANAAAGALASAEQEYRRAEATRGGQVLATRNLETFYREVLPAGFAEARRITHVKLAKMAESHGVKYERMTASPERDKESPLERLSVIMSLTGDYEDIRAFLHSLETSSDFIVIDNITLQEGGDERAPLALTLALSTYYVAGSDGA